MLGVITSKLNKLNTLSQGKGRNISDTIIGLFYLKIKQSSWLHI
ncbi:MAG: hypothetical protein ACTS4Y_02025 [Candidatus Hodgkinia cicadicola]